MRAFIRGTGSYVPKNVVKNSHFDAIGSSDAWIYDKLGIKERRISTGETTSDLAYQAALVALSYADLTPLDIDLIVLATATPDRPVPSCACFVQEKLGAHRAVSFDISAVCSGALFAAATGAPLAAAAAATAGSAAAGGAPLAAAAAAGAGTAAAGALTGRSIALQLTDTSCLPFRPSS